MNSIYLVLFAVVLELALSSQAQARAIDFSQESSFVFLFNEDQQAVLLNDAKYFVTGKLVDLGCKDIRVSTKITQEMYEAGLFEKLAGGESVAPRFELSGSATCPDQIEVLQIFISYAFHRDDFGVVLYSAYKNANSDQIVSSAFLQPFLGAPYETSSFKGYKEDCQSTWLENPSYLLLKNSFCH